MSSAALIKMIYLFLFFFLRFSLRQSEVGQFRFGARLYYNLLMKQIERHVVNRAGPKQEYTEFIISTLGLEPSWKE